jgi:hypothetical protein
LRYRGCYEGYSDEENTDTIVPFRINQANGNADAHLSGHQDQQPLHDRYGHA